MRLSNKIIEATIVDVAGEDVLPLVKFLGNKKNVSEFKIADTIKKEINQTRNMLYRLHEANLVSFIRKKDKKKGWYIYYWTFRPKMIRHLIVTLGKENLAKLKDRLAREKSSHFFICQNKCIRLDFDQAMNFDFKCPECGEIMNQEDNLENIRLIEEEIKKIENELK
ncbi:MAG: hypothetical protein KKA61_00550 [Nanoarchaeota archaeon]|nr:hypothetical protein [Nanoarchaeota archaeon]MBU4284565.1 hypothetical protein [Nanoarchaeota archaeon]MBU4492839.1 hypothetical protein [Nanoarchaeota archaeon]